MLVKYLAKIWESPGAGGAASEGDRKVQDDLSAVIGPNTIFSIMEYVHDPNYRPPPSGAPTKLFICCGQYSENRLKNYKSGMERIGSQALMVSVCLINMVMAVRKR